MNLSRLIEATADRMQSVSVDVVHNYGTVTIRDLDGEQEDILLQGDDASSFISEMDALWHQTGDLTKGTIALHLAEPYTVLWS